MESLRFVPTPALALLVLFLRSMEHKLLVRLLTALAVAGAISLVSAQQPDNTQKNKDEYPTADQAKNNASDRDIMQKIRKAIVGDSSLSTYAHNVKIISKNGKVTLRGPVRSEDEKKTVESKAVEVAGAGNVMNELTVKPEKANRESK